MEDLRVATSSRCRPSPSHPIPNRHGVHGACNRATSHRHGWSCVSFPDLERKGCARLIEASWDGAKMPKPNVVGFGGENYSDLATRPRWILKWVWFQLQSSQMAAKMNCLPVASMASNGASQPIFISIAAPFLGSRSPSCSLHQLDSAQDSSVLTKLQWPISCRITGYR